MKCIMDLRQREAAFGIDIIRQGSLQYGNLVRRAQCAQGSEQFYVADNLVAAVHGIGLPHGQPFAEIKRRGNGVLIAGGGIGGKIGRASCWEREEVVRWWR